MLKIYGGDKIYDNVEQIVVFFKNSKITYCDVKYIKISTDQVIIRQDDEKYSKGTIINFDNVESIEVLYRREINQ